MRPMRLTLIALMLPATACSTMVTIHTQPQGANVFLGGTYVGKTPTTVKLKDGLESSAGTAARLELAGHRTQHVLLQKSWSPGYVALDALACLPTLGLGCYLIYFNGKTHDSEYSFQMLEEPKPPLATAEPAAIPPPLPAPAAPVR